MSSAGDAGILALFEATPTPGYLTRWDGAEFVLVAINEAARAKTRLPESMIGRPLSPLYANQRETMEAAVQAHREKRRIVRELDVRPQHRAEVSLRLRLTFVPVEPDLLAVFSEDVSSPDRVEGALRDSEARNASIIAATREAVLVLDRQGTILLCNAAAATTFGTPEGAMLGREPEAIGRWALRDGRTELPWREALRTGGDVEAIALAFESERGERRTLRASARPIFDATTAAVTSVACTMTDVTALEATVAALRESESKYRLILESTGEGVWAVGRDGRTRFANGRMASLLGVPLEELERRSVLEVIPAEQAELFRARMDRRLAGVSETFTFVIERPDGTRVHTAATGSPVWEDGRVTGSVAMFRDLTAIRDAEEAARRSEQMLESALAAGKLGVFEFDLDTLEGHWSPHLTDMLGAQRTPGVEAYLELVHADDRARVVEVLAATISAPQSSFDTEYRVVPRENEVRWVRVTGRFEQKDGHRRLLGAIADVSERRTLEEALSRSQRLESLGRLAGGVAHDFNNLLTVIMASLSLAGDELQSGPAKAELSTARSAADRARELTRQLMAFARRQVVELSVVELHAHLGELGPMLRRLLGEDVELVLRLDPDAGAVRVDASQIEQVLVNLAVNAREAMPRGGRLEIETAAEVIDAARGASLDVAEGSYVVIRVRDTGMGMDEHTRARAFDPFFTTKADGTGLGLASVFGIVRRLSGAIVLDSELGRGTEVSVYLPRVEEHVRPSAEAPRAAAHGAGQRILLVEDDDLVRSAGARILARLGYRVEVAAHGAQALEILAAASTPFDLLMTDMIMPGMTGVELADEVRRIQPGIAVLVVSGYADVDNEQLAGHTYLQKPYSLETLSQRLGELFSGRAPKRSA